MGAEGGGGGRRETEVRNKKRDRGRRRGAGALDRILSGDPSPRSSLQKTNSPPQLAALAANTSASSQIRWQAANTRRVKGAGDAYELALPSEVVDTVHYSCK